ncbi:MAG: RNA polymerase sigma factor [Planctomycetaceae bacterium]
MAETDEAAWLNSVIELRDGYETDAVERFAARLVAMAKSRLPDRLKRRVDPEDIVQSVFRSFFERNNDGRFTFNEATDVWRLLAAITYRKVQRTIRYHHQQQRDVARDVPDAEESPPAQDIAPTASAVIMMMELLDGILERLPATHREILTLRLENFSIDEIAEELSVSSRTVNRALAVVRRIATEMIR